MRWKRRVVSRFGKVLAGSVATVNENPADEASNHAPELLSTGPGLVFTSSANLEEKLVWMLGW